MTDATNDIDALLTLLAKFGWEQHHATAKALVAEREALRKRVEELEAHPPADRDRELRERLIESALRGMGCKWMMTQSEAGIIGRQAVWIVDSALAEMRKGEQDGN